jgi:heme/copper-type cytochrome/quinol oxidase subunit 2
MQTDTVQYDTLNIRPLPKWLVDQKLGVTTIQPKKIVLKEDNSLKYSFMATIIFILLTIAVLTVYILKKFKKRV